MNGYNAKKIYSTSEVKTNKVWIDGKPIYSKVIPINNIYYSSAGYTDFANVLTGNEKVIIEINVIGYRNNDYTFPAKQGSGGYVLDTDLTKTTLRIVAGDFALYVNQIVIEYTKTT